MFPATKIGEEPFASVREVSQQTVGPLTLKINCKEYPARWAGLCKLLGRWPGSTENSQLQNTPYENQTPSHFPNLDASTSVDTHVGADPVVGALACSVLALCRQHVEPVVDYSG